VSGRESLDDLVEFISSVRDGGVSKVILHARSCLLRGLSPAQNRNIPPLQYDKVYEIVKLFPDMRFIINGGITSFDEVDNHLHRGVHGVMIGRAAYNSPLLFAEADSRFYDHIGEPKTRMDIIHNYLDYAERLRESSAFGSNIPNMCKPLHNFFNDYHDRASVKSYKHKLDNLLKENISSKLEIPDLIWDAIQDTIPKEFLERKLL
jgi:tRNA-dihydrouridine synthase A